MQRKMHYGDAVAGQVGVGVTAAGVWPRFGALIIDSIILAIVGGVVGALLGETPGQGGVGSGVAALLGLVYFSYTLSQWGQTLGGKALGVAVVDADGNRPSVGAALLRTLVSYVSGAVLLLGYLWALWDPRKQTWHDKVAGTVVVKA